MNTPRRIMVITGTRAEFGLLRSVIATIEAHPDLELQLVVTGTHLLPPANTVDEVAAMFPVAARIEAQRSSNTGRLADVAALSRLIAGMSVEFVRLHPDVVLVLGDRLEAFGAAASASLAGIRVAHLHGGDRAEGVADEAMRHAISKLANLHLSATPASAQRLARMGEDKTRIHIVGSPGLDDLASFTPLDDATFAQLGSPKIVVLHHPIGDDDATEAQRMKLLLETAQSCGRTLALHPNHDPGRDGIMQAIESSDLPHRAHLPRPTFIGVLRRAKVLLGNSSAGLIECAALGVPVVNVGPRQAGRERAENVIDVDDVQSVTLLDALNRAIARGHRTTPHSFGDGRTGVCVADLLATIDLATIPIRKLNAY